MGRWDWGLFVRGALEGEVCFLYHQFSTMLSTRPAAHFLSLPPPTSHVPAPMDESPLITYPACPRATKTAPMKMVLRVAGATRPRRPIRTGMTTTTKMKSW